MNNPEAQVALATAGIAAIFNLIITTIFDLSPAMVWVVFTGALVGLMFRPTVPTSLSSKEKIKVFIKTIFLLVFITILASWLVPFVIHFGPELARKGLAGFTGFILMVKHSEILKFVDYLIALTKRRVDK